MSIKNKLRAAGVAVATSRMLVLAAEAASASLKWKSLHPAKNAPAVLGRGNLRPPAEEVGGSTVGTWTTSTE